MKVADKAVFVLSSAGWFSLFSFRSGGGVDVKKLGVGDNESR